MSSTAGGVVARTGTRASSGEVDEAIVEAARTGDRDAFSVIVLHYSPRLRRLGFQLLGDHDLTDDVLQETYLRAYRGLASFRGGSALGTWLHRITFNCCQSELRGRVRRIEGVEVASEVLSTPVADCGSGRSDLLAALAALPLQQRAAVLLVHLQGLSYQEAAMVLGVRPGTVGSRLSSARDALRRVLE